MNNKLNELANMPDTTKVDLTNPPTQADREAAHRIIDGFTKIGEILDTAILQKNSRG